MKEAIKVSPYELVTNTEAIKELFAQYHKDLTKGITNSKHFESLIPEIITPNFVALYGSSSQGKAVNAIIDYIEKLIPTSKEPRTTLAVDASGMLIKDEKGKSIPVVVKDADGKVIYDDVPLFDMSKSAYEKIQRLINNNFVSLSMYWDARSFVAKNISTIDEKMFDKMNDYLWRHIMAVVYPEDVKREFKHLCINVKRKLYYLGDRNEVFNQTVFGLYDDNKGGTGKTTLLEAFAKAFSDGNPMICRKLDELFGFNARTANKFGICFVDENARGAKTEVKDAVKAFIDADTRTVELKGVDQIDINHLFTMVVSANHKISNRLFEDEARGQRRDACFEVIGLLQQYTERDMVSWFQRMFATCPIDDDQKTYRHRNPHSNELSDGEMTIMSKILDTPMTPPRGQGFKLGEISERLNIKSRSDEWHRLRTLLQTKYFITLEDHDRSKYYLPDIDKISARLNGSLSKRSDGWTIDFRDSRPFIDVESVISDLEANASYDTTAEITYDSYFVEG